MEKNRVTPTALVVLALLTSLASFQWGEPGEGAVVNEFKTGGDSIVLEFTGPATLKTAQLSLEPNVTFSGASMDITGLPNSAGKCPWNVTLDLGDDNKLEWRFKGEGVGAWGEQTQFNDSKTSHYVIFQGSGGENPAAIRLPKGAVVNSAVLDVSGDSLDIHFLSASQSLTSQEQDDINRLQALGYSVASTPVSGSITPQGACIAFTEDLSSNAAAIHNVMTQGVPVLINGKGLQTLDNLGLTTTSSWRSWGGGCNSFKVQANYAGIMNGLTLGQTYTPFNYLGSNTLYGVLEPPDNTFSGVNLASFIGGAGWDTECHIGVVDPAAHSYVSTYVGSVDSKVFVHGYYLFPSTTMTSTWNTLLGNALTWMIGGVSVNGPEDVTVNLGPTGAVEVYSHPGELNAREKTGDFATELNTYMAAAQTAFTDDYGTEFVDIPLNVTTSTGGRVRIDNLSVTYDYTAHVDFTDALNEHIGKNPLPLGGANWTIDLAIKTDSAGKVRLDNLNVSYDGPPLFRSDMPTTLECHEDTPAPYLLDLSAHAFDDFDAPTELTYEVTKNSQKEWVDVFITDGHWLGVDPSKTPNWNSLVQTEGLVEVRVKVTDSNNLSALSPIILVDVLPVNDEPTAGEEMPDINMLEGEEDTSILMNGKAYFTDVEFDPLRYLVKVDPMGAIEGEEGNLTAEMDPATTALTVRAHGDYFTADEEPVPLWIYCDDDDAVNTEEDGYLDAEETIPNWTHQEVLVHVVNVNDAPVVADIPDLETLEDVPNEGELILADYVTDIDSPPETWQFKLRSNNNKRLRVTIDETTSAVSLLPQPDAFGTGRIEAEVSDGDDKTRFDFRVVVEPVNDRPELEVIMPAEGSRVSGNVTFSGTSVDVEKTQEYVEFSPGPGEPWARVLGTDTWNHIWDTAALPNGPVEVAFRVFDGELYSLNVTLNLIIDNPINSPPAVRITSPGDGQVVPAGIMTVTGSSSDTDGGVKRILLQIGDDPTWLVIKDTGTGLTQWSYELNNSRWAGEKLTIRAQAADGRDRSPAFNVTFTVEGAVDGGDGDDDLPQDKGSVQEKSLVWLWVLIVAVVAAVVAIVVILMMVTRKRKERAWAEEEERKEREKREAEEKDDAFRKGLLIAEPAGPSGADVGGWSAAGPPLPGPPPPPLPVVGGSSAPPPPMPVAGGYGAFAYLGTTQETPLLPPGPAPASWAGPGGPQAPPPPAGGASPPPPPPPPPPGSAPHLMEVNCYACGGKVPVTSAQRPLSITCPSCGAQGEI